METTETALIAEQLIHALDLLRAEIAALRLDVEHLKEITGTRLTHLETSQADHEQRIRAATDGVTQFKVWSGLSSGAASLISLFALFRTILGGP